MQFKRTLQNSLAARHLSFDQAISLLDIYEKKMKAYVKRRLKNILIVALFKFPQIKNSTNYLSTEKWRSKLLYSNVIKIVQ